MHLLGSALRTSVGHPKPNLSALFKMEAYFPSRPFALPLTSQKSGAGNGSEHETGSDIPIPSTGLDEEKGLTCDDTHEQDRHRDGSQLRDRLCDSQIVRAEGANVVVTARRSDALDALLVAEIERDGGQRSPLPAISGTRLGSNLVETAINRFGGLDIAFNNAGTNGEMGPTPGVSLAG